MRKKNGLLAFVSGFLLLTAIMASSIMPIAAQRTVGVSVGDWAQYDVTFSGNLTWPSPVELPDWVKNTVQEISDTNITFEALLHYTNGSEETEIYVLDVDTGQGNGTGLFIAANLNAGDPIYTSPNPWDTFYGMTINETVSRTYLGGSVTVNHWNQTTKQTIPEVMNQTMSNNYYWYRATGMMAGVSYYQLLQQAGNTTWYEMEIVITGIIPEFPPALILPLLMIATLATVWFGKAIRSTKKSIKKPSPCA